MTKAPAKSGMIRKQRCAIYTRKSSEEGLEQEFNSLHAQRESCEAFIASQRSEGWVLVRDQYEDHTQRLLQFQRSLEAALPAALAAHTRVANFRLGKLFIHATNGAVAAKLRQLGPRIASELSNKGVKVTQIEVRVQAGIPYPPTKKHERPALPGIRQKQGLTALARNLPAASPLKAALDRLLRSIKE